VRFLLTALLSASFLAGEAASVRSASLSVAPTRLELGPDDTMAVVTLQNNADTPVTVQVQTFAWPHTPATDDLEPTRELVAVPPVVALPPNGKQLIRVAPRAKSDRAVERSYRLVITEVPGSEGGSGVRFALRLSLPVFVTPEGARPQPLWSALADGKELLLELANRGTAHLQLRRILLRARGRADPVQVIEAPGYVLPGQTQTWPLGDAARAQTTLQLQAETNLGPIEAVVLLPQS
jgi:fimbrial chaperone protein